MKLREHIPMPILLLLLLPAIISFYFGFEYMNEPYKNIPTVIVNHDNSKTALDLVSIIENNEAFDVIKYGTQDADIETAIENGTAMAGILIPADFSSNLMDGKQATIMVFNDGALSPGASSVRSSIAETLGTIKSGYLIKIAEQKLGLSQQAAINMVAPTGYTVRTLGNPQRKFTYFLFPGILLTIVQIGVLSFGASIGERRSYLNMLTKTFAGALAGVASAFACMWIQFFWLPLSRLVAGRSVHGLFHLPWLFVSGNHPKL